MSKPNLLFLLSDEHSYRFLSARSQDRGGEPCNTATLDNLIENGVHFETAYCQNPVCIPSRVGFLSGRPSSECAVLSPEIQTFASYLGENGYNTATVGKMHLTGSLQLGGFRDRPYGDFTSPSPAHQKDPLHLIGSRDHIFMPSVLRDVGVSQIPEAFLQEQIVAREAISWIREQDARNHHQPWLLMASFAHPHFPMNASTRFFNRYWPQNVTSPRIGRTGDSASHPLTISALKSESGESRGCFLENVSEEQCLKARAAYFACVDQLDEVLGDFLAVLDRDGFLKNTIIIYTSDHGELAGEHGLWFKRTWHEASVRVPFIISTPEHRNGDLRSSEINMPVSLSDLFPTFCGFAGLPRPSGLDGVDLSPIVWGGDSSDLDKRPGVIVEHFSGFGGPGTEYRGIRSHRYKVVNFRGCQDLAFDLETDPEEQVNLFNAGNGLHLFEVETLQSILKDRFDYNTVLDRINAQKREFSRLYPARVFPKTSNQILLGNGLLVDADTLLEFPNIVSKNPSLDFDDWMK